jgi:hypothetical protein
LGCGFPLFYDYFKALILIIIFGIVLTIFPLYDNLSAGNESEWDEELDGHWIIRGSIAAHGTDGEPKVIQAWLFATLSWVIMITYVCAQLRRKYLSKQIDADTISPSDFTLYFTGLPKNMDDLAFR